MAQRSRWASRRASRWASRWRTQLLLCGWGCICVSALVSVLASTSASADRLDHSLSRRETGRQLAKLERRVEKVAAEGKQPLVVFDIDDTLVHKGSAMPGAVSFTTGLVKAGARLVYVSGRGEYKKQESITLLKHLGLPVKGQKFLFNPGKMDAAQWKAAAQGEILKRGVPLGFVENDKRAACQYSKQYPDAKVFRMNTRSSRDPLNRPGRNLSVIRGYYRRR